MGGEMSGGGTFVMEDPDLQEVPAGERERLEAKIAGVEEEMQEMRDLTFNLDDQGKNDFEEEYNVSVDDPSVFSKRDIELAMKYDVLERSEDRQNFVNSWDALMPGARLGIVRQGSDITVPRSEIMAETAEAATQKLDALKRKLSEFTVEETPLKAA